ncbi:hypothetical protein MJO28_015399 [Puccinia striiformis f. sp. tritici]|uniref:Uncharacterized protein n=1 Tax=Puccinia striiformis f. sp. tritici TaxID=168172 RepID=A0ACC0DSE1_9BASI|nr:hypothetical protein Pst134EA_028169 [Puccinia striiformis f. sp. tritici]KAH9448877.1 hypothetical protein Pst134EA_028169 [Puccinia striiformis f. sp. tritici]KAI7938479.1 hypothetical protein MJO28_015399 [Puccinia striiformis f. sp. tritici]
MTFKITRKAPKNPSSEPSGPSERAPGVLGVFKRHVKFLGPGIVASAAYYDPGNWATDIQAGSRFGNAHLFILLVAVTVAVFLQILATRLGFISRKDIAQNCRAALYKGHAVKKWVALYPLWLIFELGILSADMGELLGSATALILLFPRLPPFVAVLLTFPEIFLALLFFRNGKQSKRSMQIFEIMIAIVVMAVVVSALVLFFKVNPNIPQVFAGFIPSKALVTGSAFYTAIGIIGATVGPHSLILGASMATQDRTSEKTDEKKAPPADGTVVYINRSNRTKGDIEKQPEDFMDPRQAPPVPSVSKIRSVLDCKSYLAHASFDIAASIFTLPLIVNSAILVIASTTFFYNNASLPVNEEADLVAMHELLKTRLGTGLATLFAVSLWLSGNAASLTITMAGQSISSGFLEYKTSPLMRRLITRTLGIIPAAIIAAISKQKGINDMLIASQVAISIVLPFAVIPLAYFTSRTGVMSISVPHKIGRLFSEDERVMTSKHSKLGPMISRPDPYGSSLSQSKSSGTDGYKEFNVSQLDGTHSFANHWVVRILIVVLVLVILASNVYGIYQVATGS